MATTDAEYVVDNTPDDRTELGFSGPEIDRRLTAGGNKFRVAEAVWRKKARSYLELVNTSESGSSRGNDALYQRALGEADRLAKLADASEAVTETTTVGRLGSISINRI